MAYDARGWDRRYTTEGSRTAGRRWRTMREGDFIPFPDGLFDCGAGDQPGARARRPRVEFRRPQTMAEALGVITEKEAAVSVEMPDSHWIFRGRKL